MDVASRCASIRCTLLGLGLHSRTQGRPYDVYLIVLGAFDDALSHMPAKVPSDSLKLITLPRPAPIRVRACMHSGLAEGRNVRCTKLYPHGLCPLLSVSPACPDDDWGENTHPPLSRKLRVGASAPPRSPPCFPFLFRLHNFKLHRHYPLRNTR